MSEFNQKLAEKIVDGLYEGDSTANVMSICALLDKTYGGEPVTREALRGSMGESVHVAFRKGGLGDFSDRIWVLIREMPRDEWSSVLDFIVYCLGEVLQLPKGD